MICTGNSHFHDSEGIQAVRDFARPFSAHAAIGRAEWAITAPEPHAEEVKSPRALQ
jgi:hypothetical protein